MRKTDSQGSLSRAQSLVIKLAVFSIGLLLVLWFGWSVPQANQARLDVSQGHEVLPDVKRGVAPSSLDINQGTREEFQTLPGIGPVLAGRILAYRESRGHFTDIEDLKMIKGIGEMKFRQVKQYIRVTGTEKNGSHRTPNY